jgi:hypothetical protein
MCAIMSCNGDGVSRLAFRIFVVLIPSTSFPLAINNNETNHSCEVIDWFRMLFQKLINRTRKWSRLAKALHEVAD